MVLWNVIFWAVLTVILIGAEIATVQMVAVWFAAGGLLAFISSFFGIPFYVQIIVFIAGSILMLLSTRKLVHKFLHGKKQKTNADRLIGSECIVKEEIDNLKGTGRVYTDGLDWAAKSTSDDSVCPVGCSCVIREIQGVKLIVEKYSE